MAASCRDDIFTVMSAEVLEERVPLTTHSLTIVPTPNSARELPSSSQPPEKRRPQPPSPLGTEELAPPLAANHTDYQSPDRNYLVEDFLRYVKHQGTTKREFEKEVAVIVVDYGFMCGKPVCYINGTNADEIQQDTAAHHVSSSRGIVRRIVAKKCATTEDFITLLPTRSGWDRFVRWIDIEGVNGAITQTCLRQMDAEEQCVFNMIADPNENSMSLDLNVASDTGDLKVLLRAVKVSLSDAAEGTLDKLDLDGSEFKMYDVDDVQEEEPISYLCKVSRDRSSGTLITIQTGMEDSIFDAIRDEICNKQSKLYERDVAYLFMKLLRASSDSMFHVVSFMNSSLSQLESDLKVVRDSNSQESCSHFLNSIRVLSSEVQRLMRRFETLSSAVQSFATDHRSFCGDEAMVGWRSLGVQHQSMNVRLRACQERGAQVLDIYNDIHHKRVHERQVRMEKIDKRQARGQNVMSLVLAIFNPLAFITGLYGMNFAKPDGTPGMPELSWGYEYKDPSNHELGVVRTGITGYGIFWILVVFIVLLVLTIYLFLGLVVVPSPRSCWNKLRGDGSPKRPMRSSTFES